MSKIVSIGDHYVHPVKKDGNTYDIIKGIIDADKCNLPYINDAKPLRADTILETCQNIFNLVKENISYNEDEEGKQWIQSPGELWNNRKKSKGGTGEGGDCKSMSIFCAAILKMLGIYDFLYRFVSEKPDEEFYHVYLIVQNDEGDSYIVLDCTLDNFDVELNIAKHMDIEPSGPDSVCPFPAPVKMGAPTYEPGKTEAQNSGDLWAAHETTFATNFANNQNYINQLKTDIMGDITVHFSDPTKKGHAHGFIWDNWNDHMKSSALMIYTFWGDPSLELADFPANKIPAISNVDIWVGPTEIAFKKSNSDAYYNDLLNMGISHDHILQMVKLSMYNNHGITLDYMLYRCYNKLVYGQEWGPQPGVPYYDANSKTYFANGATQAEYGALLNAFPIDGGTGKPWGIPYVARGVFIMTNGASDGDIANLSNQIDINGWQDYINTYIFPGGTKTYIPLDQDSINLATQTYYNWQQGNLPVLYSSAVAATQGGSMQLSGSQIGGPPVVALVAAIITAVATIIAALLNFLAQTQAHQAAMQATPAMAPIDFKLQYETADGCSIGFTSTCTNGVAKICGPNSLSPGIQCNPTLTLPENSPPNQNHLNPGSSNAMLWGGLALLAVGAIALTGDDD